MSFVTLLLSLMICVSTKLEALIKRWWIWNRILVMVDLSPFKGLLLRHLVVKTQHLFFSLFFITDLFRWLIVGAISTAASKRGGPGLKSAVWAFSVWSFACYPWYFFRNSSFLLKAILNQPWVWMVLCLSVLAMWHTGDLTMLHYTPYNGWDTL